VGEAEAPPGSCPCIYTGTAYSLITSHQRHYSTFLMNGIFFPPFTRSSLMHCWRSDNPCSIPCLDYVAHLEIAYYVVGNRDSVFHDSKRFGVDDYRSWSRPRLTRNQSSCIYICFGYCLGSIWNSDICILAPEGKTGENIVYLQRHQIFSKLLICYE
jgi:hypothetical protein